MASAPHSISLADLTALNDEIAALARMGVPLEKGLRELGSGLPRRLSNLTDDVADRLSRGESLAEVLGDQRSGFPPVYRAVVEAGMRAGRLPVALEGLAGAARRLAELRRYLAAAMIYPLILLLVAVGLFQFFFAKVLPSFVKIFELDRSGAPPLPRYIQALQSIADSAAWWSPAVIVLVLLAAGIWWYRARQAVVSEGRSQMLRWLPAMGRLVRNSQSACLADILSLLVEHNVPLDEAVELAAGATGNPTTVAAARKISASLKRGAPIAPEGETVDGFPHLLIWLISNEQSQARLAPLLKHTADNYREQAFRQAAWIRIYVPLLFAVGIGGTAVALYALSVFLPMVNLLEYFSAPRFR